RVAIPAGRSSQKRQRRMEPLWSPVVATGGNQSQIRPAPKRRKQAKTVAVGCDGKEGLVPVVHDTTYEALREVSPLLGSRSGLNTAEDAMADVAGKLAELVAL